MLVPVLTNEFKILRDTLLAHTNLAALVARSSGDYKIFLEIVPEYITLPYIIIYFMSGGNEYLARAQGVQSSKSIYKVVFITEDASQSILASDYIAQALSNVQPVITKAGINCYSTIKEISPFVDHYIQQNRIFYQIGGYYQICLEYNKDVYYV